MQPHRLMGQRRRQPQLYHLARQQPQSPVVVAFRCWAAGQCNQVGLPPVVQLPVPVGLGPVLERPVHAILGETSLDPVHRAVNHVQGLGHLGRWPTLVGLKQDAGPRNHPSSALASPNQMLQLVPLLRTQPDCILLPDHTATSQQHFPESGQLLYSVLYITI